MFNIHKVTESNNTDFATLTSPIDKIIEEKDNQIVYLKELLKEKKSEIGFWKDFYLNAKNKQVNRNG